MINELSHIICGDDYTTSNGITLHNPTLREIKEFGEFNYLKLIEYITMRPYDIAVELWDKGVNYQDVSDFTIFISNVKGLPNDFTELIFGDLDFQKFEAQVNPQNMLPVLTNGKYIIDEMIYREIVEYVRRINYIEEKVEYDMANKAGIKFLIQRMRRKREKAAKKTAEPYLSNLISTMVNTADFPYNYSTIFDVKISQLYNGFYRKDKIDTAHQITQAIYAGTINKKDVSNSLLNYYGELKKNKS